MTVVYFGSEPQFFVVFFQTSFDIVLVWMLSCLSNRKFLNTSKFLFLDLHYSILVILQIYPHHPSYFSC